MGDSAEQQQPSSSEPKPTGSDENREDLATLLDSALADFGKQRNTDNEIDELMEKFDNSAAKEAAQQFQNMLTQMLEVQQEAEKQAAQGTQNQAEVEEMRSFAEAMSKMAQCSADVANASDEKSFLEAMMKMGGDGSPMEPFMGMMMQAFMAKDVMYPPLKELANGFPTYLEAHKDTLDAETFERYKKQQDAVGRICAEYEVDIDENDQASNHERMERLGKLLLELQSHGYPPQELAGNLPPGWSLDNESGVPKLDDAAQAAENCALM
ncbi:hypothetical protein QR680_012925 [Steinernema hermaphroditum]|uniref:Peroxin-19 n=1 Tax=Steinernema hermaphroditum TaxID=289476 RepID=A0AA39I3S6_9BILA|nr:hypothetical protein QR680_012925 [Steinernema hermaphroditum]